MSSFIGIDKNIGPLEDAGALLIKPHGVPPDSAKSNKFQHDVSEEEPTHKHVEL